MIEREKQRVALVTGSAGFIGFHVSKKLLENGWRVIGLDCISDYYDVTLKHQRERILLQSKHYRSIHEKVEASGKLLEIFEEERPDIVVHLAAQAGVRYSIDNPRAYLESNIFGTFELLEAARAYPPAHLLLASTSSAYGSNTEMPFKEVHKADHQMSFYAATKKSTENMAHSYSHLFNLPVTMFRFFTVYGPWGRPDMALFKFTKNIIEAKPIDVYNSGAMYRDFTYIDDLVNGIVLLIDVPPRISETEPELYDGDSLSPVAPHRVVNIGNSNKVRLMDFIDAIESALGKKAIKNYMPMQPGDVSATWADASLLKNLTDFEPRTDVKSGVQSFVSWYQNYYQN